jgi:hypothetical protein
MDFNRFAKRNVEYLDLMSWFAYLPLKNKIEIYLDYLELQEDHYFDYLKYPNEDN